jgi:hypothetical protein
VTARLEGETLARWRFPSHYTDAICGLLLPFRLLAGAPYARLSFEVENPQSPAEEPLREGRDVIGDDLIRELGIKIQTIALAGTDVLRYSWGDTISFLPEGSGLRYLEQLWSNPDQHGTWTIGPDAGLVMYLPDAPEGSVAASFTISDAAVSEAFPDMTVAVSFNGEHVADWRLGPERVVHTRTIIVPSLLLARPQPLRISFQIRSPHSPAQLNWYADPRPFGFRLIQLRLEPRKLSAHRLAAYTEVKEGTIAPRPPIFVAATRTRVGRLVRGLGRQVSRLIR